MFPPLPSLPAVALHGKAADTVAEEGQIETLHSDEPEAENSFDEPNKVPQCGVWGQPGGLSSPTRPLPRVCGQPSPGSKPAWAALAAAATHRRCEESTHLPPPSTRPLAHPSPARPPIHPSSRPPARPPQVAPSSSTVNGLSSKFTLKLEVGCQRVPCACAAVALAGKYLSHTCPLLTDPPLPPGMEREHPASAPGGRALAGTQRRSLCPPRGQRAPRRVVSSASARSARAGAGWRTQAAALAGAWLHRHLRACGWQPLLRWRAWSSEERRCRLLQMLLASVQAPRRF